MQIHIAFEIVNPVFQQMTFNNNKKQLFGHDLCCQKHLSTEKLSVQFESSIKLQKLSVVCHNALATSNNFYEFHNRIILWLGSFQMELQLNFVIFFFVRFSPRLP